MTLRRAGVWIALASALVGQPPPAWAQPTGDPGRGAALFTVKACARCHRAGPEPGVGPPLDEVRRPQGAFELAGRLWNHAPAMFEMAGQAGVRWPRISPPEMADLMAYLQADAARDPAPDLFKGEAILVRKGCLKCHNLRGEGGRVGPDLGARRPVYDSAVAWAAAMWIHTPTMAAKAREMGITYPRFDDYELSDLVGYLRSAAR